MTGVSLLLFNSEILENFHCRDICTIFQLQIFKRSDGSKTMVIEPVVSAIKKQF